MFKKNWYLFTPLILVIIPALLWTYYTAAYGYQPGEALEATRYFLQSSTRYAQKYSDNAFDRLKPGLDGRQVFELIGVPFERHDNDGVWIYSLPNGTTPYYHERKVLFQRDASNVPRVKEAVKAFHTP